MWPIAYKYYTSEPLVNLRGENTLPQKGQLALFDLQEENWANFCAVV